MNLLNSLRANLLAGFATLLVCSPAAAQLTGMTDDGWHTWRVTAIESAPEICCFRWNMGKPSARGCNLDKGHGGFSTNSDGGNATGELQVYALLEGGEVKDLRALSSSCPVSADSTITDLGPVNPDTSATWLKERFESNDEIASDVLAAIAFHSGNNARAALIHQGRRNDNPEIRSEAWFWLAQTEAEESEDVILKAMRDDKDDDVREESVFALSQLPNERAVHVLAVILEDRRLDKDLREQALFWLTQADSDEAFEYIDRVLSDN